MTATRRRIGLLAALVAALVVSPTTLDPVHLHALLIGAAGSGSITSADGMPSFAVAAVASPPISSAAIATTALPSPSGLGTTRTQAPSPPPPAFLGSRTSTATDPHTGQPIPLLPSDLDDATGRALELQDRVELANQDAVALEQRIAVVNVRIRGQESELEDARLEAERSMARFEERLVEIYKSGLSSPFALLLSARSLSDFYTRLLMLSRIIAEDARSYRDAEIASRKAQFVASVLDDMKAQLVTLRGLYTRRLKEASEALAEERALIATLSAKSQAYVAERQAATARTRKQWRESSIAIGTPIGFASAILEPSGDTYLASDYQPSLYSALGEPFSAVCSWYGNEFNGRPTASGQIFNQDDLTCASRTLPFGTRIALARGARRVIVVVTDRGPFIAGRDLDLSRAAARALGFSGVARVSAMYVKPSSEVTASVR